MPISLTNLWKFDPMSDMIATTFRPMLSTFSNSKQLFFNDAAVICLVHQVVLKGLLPVIDYATGYEDYG
jgi:hypothetical protein